jgi:tRNA-2-methylthio-N6-dimethylallyladenosine synthase
MADTKKLFIKTYGCQMNVYDSERMAETLGAQGYVQTDTADDADMILLKTCPVSEFVISLRICTGMTCPIMSSGATA